MAASAALLQGDYMAAAKINGTVVQPAYQNAKAAADALREYYAKTGRGLYETAQADFQWSTRLMIALVVLVILLIAGFAYVLGRSITRPIGHAVGVAERVAAGQLDNRIEVVGNDEAAVLMGALQRMQGELKANIEAERKTAQETLRIKVALDVTSNSVMVADPDGKIIYCNHSVLEMMRNAEADLRKQLPNFRADAILGSNFDIYHRNPAHQRNVLGAQSGASYGNQRWRPLFSLVACPIINDAGERLGTAVEWRDRTARSISSRRWRASSVQPPRGFQPSPRHRPNERILPADFRWHQRSAGSQQQGARRCGCHVHPSGARRPDAENRRGLSGHARRPQGRCQFDGR
jgi:methyl-accepting chemotaxis protein